MTLSKVGDFLTEGITIGGGVTIPNWVWIALILGILIVIIVIASALKNSRKDAEDKTVEKEETAEPETYIPADNENEETGEEIETVSSALDRGNGGEEPSPESDSGGNPGEVVEVDSDGNPGEIATAEGVVGQPEKTVERIAEPRTEGEGETADLIETADGEPGESSAGKTTEDNSSREESASKAKGKFELVNSFGGFRYMLLANNGQLLYESRDYKAMDSCKEAVSKFVNAVVRGDFSVRGDKFGNYKFMLKSPTSNNLIYIGESYETKKACLNAVESVKRFAPVSDVVDATRADFVAEAELFAIPEDVIRAVEKRTGVAGKWEIATSEQNNPKSPFVFLLFANNGQLLYESRDYKTMSSCQNGIETFVKTVKDGAFIIDRDKFGRYRFILRSRRAGSQTEYHGQNYDDKSACESSVVSVYKFALLTPTE